MDNQVSTKTANGQEVETFLTPQKKDTNMTFDQKLIFDRLASLEKRLEEKDATISKLETKLRQKQKLTRTPTRDELSSAFYNERLSSHYTREDMAKFLGVVSSGAVKSWFEARNIEPESARYDEKSRILYPSDWVHAFLADHFGTAPVNPKPAPKGSLTEGER